MGKRTDRIGETFINNEGCVGKIVGYVNNKEVYVMFENCLKPIKCGYKEVKNGGVKNPFHTSVYGVGFFGQGDYLGREDGEKTKHYLAWHSMMERCYSEKHKKKRKTYENCSVCDEWHNFQNFAKWFEENYYEIEGERIHLDKDILCKGNTLYSPDTCVFVPLNINTLFIKSNSTRGEHPIGVSYHKRNKTFTAYCHTIAGLTHLGSYTTAESAFQAYKEFKENYIKQIANAYKNRIPTNLYEAMLEYKVEITD